METQIGIDDVLRNLSERGQLEWELFGQLLRRNIALELDSAGS